MNKTAKMQYLELKYGKTIEEILGQMLTLKGLNKTATQLGIGTATINRWTKRLGLKSEKIIIQREEVK